MSAVKGDDAGDFSSEWVVCVWVDERILSVCYLQVLSEVCFLTCLEEMCVSH